VKINMVLTCDFQYIGVLDGWKTFRCLRCNKVLSTERVESPQEKGGEVNHSVPCGNQRSKGLGDTIAKVTSAVGIKPCGGCKKRQRLLNKLVPYNDK